MQIYAILCLCLVNFVFESNAKTVPLNMQVPIVADFRMTNLKEYIDSKISKELKKASETETKVEKLEDILSSLRTKFENMSEIQDTLSKQIDGINGTASETESKVEKLEDILSSLRIKFKNVSDLQDNLSKQLHDIQDTDTVKKLTDEIKQIKKLQEEIIKNITKLLNNVGNERSGLKDVIGQTFYLMFSPNIHSADLLLASTRNGECNLNRLGTSSGDKIILQDKSIIKTIKGSAYKRFKLLCNVPVKLLVFTHRQSFMHSHMDSYIAIPIEYLGTEYLIPSYIQTKKGGPGTYIGIVATSSNTTVAIVGKDRKKISRTVTINKEKSWYQYNNDRIDISGSYVKATTPVAVFSNIVCVLNDDSACHPFSDMVVPMKDYSKDFYIPHFKNVGRWTIRLYAKTTCRIKVFDKRRNQLSIVTVKSDTKFVEIDHKAMSSVVSSCPSMIQLYGHLTAKGPSFMVLVPGNDKYLSYYCFMVPNYTSSLYVMIKTVHMKEIRIDDSVVSPNQYEIFQDPTNPNINYAVYSVSVSAGRHVVKTVNDAPFGLWIYGKGFAYPAGYGVKTK